jgi:hypothetical protein
VGLVGPNVDPLGDGLIRLLPDGFAALLAPALAPPALKLPGAVAPDGAVLCPVVVPLDIDPLGGAAPTPAVPPVPAPAAPPPLWANASVLVNASAVANPSVVAFIFIVVSLAVFIGDKLSSRHMFRR